MFLEQFGEFRNGAFLVRGKVVMNVPAEVVLAEIVDRIPSRVSTRSIQRVHPEILRVTEFLPQLCVFNTAPQRPHGKHKWQLGQFEPGRAKIKNFVWRACRAGAVRRRTGRWKSIAGSPMSSTASCSAAVCGSGSGLNSGFSPRSASRTFKRFKPDNEAVWQINLLQFRQWTGDAPAARCKPRRATRWQRRRGCHSGR